MIQELMEGVVDYNDVEVELDQHMNRLGYILEQLSIVAEGKEDGHLKMGKSLDDVIGQMKAAKRGLGLVNKLKPGQTRATHAKRVMGNMNKIRGHMKRIEKSVK